MHNDNDSDILAEFLTGETLRPILSEIGARLGTTEPAEVLQVALAVFSTVSDEKVAHGARLLLEYPNGDCKELKFWKTSSPKLVAKNGKLVDAAAP
jgi:hypothetical protein